MGFFDFLRGGKEEDDGPGREPEDIGPVEILKLREVISARMSGDLGEEKAKAKEKHGEIMTHLEKVRELGNDLLKEKFKSGQKHDAPVNMIKDNYAKRAVSVVDGVPYVGEFSHAELSSFCSELERRLGGIENIPQREAMTLSKFFKDGMSKIVREMKKIEEKRSEMLSIIQEKALLVEGENEKRTKKLLEMFRKRRDLEGQEAVLKEKIGDMEKETEQKKRELNDFLKSAGYKDYLRLGKEINRLSEEKEQARCELRREMSAVKRPLKKLVHSLKGGNEKESIARLSGLSKSPLKTLLEGGDSVLSEALEKMKEVDVKGKQEEKIEELRKKVGLGYTSKLIDKCRYTDSEIEDLRKKMENSAALRKEESMKGEIRNLEKMVEEYKKEAGKIEENRKETESEMKREREELESFLAEKAGLKTEILM